jgi:glutathione S-transferase
MAPISNRAENQEEGHVMIKLYHADRMRSARIYWLLEELGLSYQLETVEYVPPAVAFSQHTPLGKFPVLEDGDLTMMESGAIVEYVLDRYGRGRLAPEHGSHLRGQFLQWIHFAEATLMPPVVDVFRHTRLKPEPERIPAVVIDARTRAAAILTVVERAIEGKEYLLGKDFTGADVMMGYSLQVADWLGLLTETYPNLRAYLGRLKGRPAFVKVFGAS